MKKHLQLIGLLLVLLSTWNCERPRSSTRTEKIYFGIKVRNAITNEIVPDFPLSILRCNPCSNNACFIEKTFYSKENGAVSGQLNIDICTSNAFDFCCNDRVIIGAPDTDDYIVEGATELVPDIVNNLQVVIKPYNVLGLRLKRVTGTFPPDGYIKILAQRLDFSSFDFNFSQNNILEIVDIPFLSPNIDTTVFIRTIADKNIALSLASATAFVPIFNGTVAVPARDTAYLDINF